MLQPPIGELPEEIIHNYYVSAGDKIVDIIFSEMGDKYSKAEIKRLIKQGGIKFNGEKITDINFNFKAEASGVVKVGKREFIKISPVEQNKISEE